MLATTLGLGIPLILGIITATVTLRVKRMELAAKVDDRQIESLRRGYDLVLAATDLTWHHQCHIRLNDVGIDLPADWQKNWPKLRTRIDATLLTGVDLLKQYSSQYHNVQIVLNWAWQVTREGHTLRMMASGPTDYAEVRDHLIECSRADARVSEPLKSKYWKEISRSSRPQRMADLDASGVLSRVQAMLSAGQVGTFVVQDTGDDEDGNVILAYMKNLREAPNVYVPSLAITEGRIQEWQNRGVIDLELFCTSGDETCSDKMYRLIEDDKTEEAGE